MTGSAARAFVALLAVALFVAFVKGGPAEMLAWLARTLTGDPSYTSTLTPKPKAKPEVRRSPDSIRKQLKPYIPPKAPHNPDREGPGWDPNDYLFHQ